MFWINLPIGGAALVVFVLVTPNRKPPGAVSETWKGKLKQLDPIGFILVAPAAVCLLFALQWGGIKYPWNDGRIIALFVVAGVLGVTFICSQIWIKDGTVPGKIVSQRSMIAGIIQIIGIGSSLIVYSLYLPLWFQAIKGDSPQSSGLALLALLLSTVVAVILSGVGTTATGYYVPFAIAGGAILVVGAALITTWQVDTSMGIWIGYQIILGTGQGLSLQQPNFAAQTVLPKEQAPTGLAVLQFVQSLFGTIFVTVCQTLLQNRLVQRLAPLGIDGNAVANGGATSLRSLVPADKLPQVLDAYNDSLKGIWYAGLAMAILGFLASFGYEWKNVKEAEQKLKLAGNDTTRKEEKDSNGTIAESE